MLWVRMNMVCFDRWSTIMRMVSKPEEEGSFSMKSIEIEFYGRFGIGSCWRDPYGLWCCGLDLIQVMQDLQNFCMSSRMFGQIQCLRMSFSVLFWPRCPTRTWLWWYWRTRRHKLALFRTYILLSSLRNPAPSFDQRPSGWSKWLEMEESKGSVARILE